MLNIVKTFLVSVAFLFSANVFSADVTYIPSVSHFNNTNADGGKWNNETNGIKLELDNKIIMGTLKNSYFKQSTFIGYTWRPVKISKIEAGMIVAAISGYDSSKMATKLPVIVVASLKIPVYNASHIEAIVAPTVGKHSGFVGVGFGFSF